MRARPQAIASQPDRRFLVWVLTGLVAGTMATGFIAVTTAMLIAGVQ